MGYETDESLGCCPTVMQIFIMSVNSILALASLGLVGFGIWMYTSDYITLTGDTFANVVVMFGCAIFIITFMGWFSACRQSICGLSVFGVLLTFIIIAEAAAVILLVSNEDETRSFLAERWEELAQDNKEDLQSEFECCGFDMNITGENCPDGVSTDDYCWDAIKSDLQSEEDTILYIGLSILTLELLMLMFTCSLRSSLKVIKSGDNGPFYKDYPY